MTAWRHISGAKRNSASQSVLKLEFGTILKRSTSHLLVLYPAHGLQVHATNMLPLPPLQPFDTFWWRNVAHVLNSSGLSDAFKLDVELITAHALHQILCHIWSVLKSQLWEVEKTESAVEQPHKPSQTSTSFLRGKTWHSESRCLTNSKACISTHSIFFSLQKYIKVHKPEGKKTCTGLREHVTTSELPFTVSPWGCSGPRRKSVEYDMTKWWEQLWDPWHPWWSHWTATREWAWWEHLANPRPSQVEDFWDHGSVAHNFFHIIIQ